MKRDVRHLGTAKRSRLQMVVFAGVVLAGFVTYAVVIPYMMITNMNWESRTGTLSIHKAGGRGRSSLSGRRLQRLPTQQQQQQQQQRQQQASADSLAWEGFWGSESVTALRAMQQLKHTLDMIRYQRLIKDVEDQATAGLDVMLAEQLAQLSNATKLHKVQAWLRQEVTGAVQEYLHRLQHPANCTTARKLTCYINKQCGFGCQLHHTVHCFAHAVALNRTMVLKVYPWNYGTQPHTWEDQLLGVSSCTSDDLVDPHPPEIMPARDLLLHDKLEVALDIIDKGASKYDPPALPQDVLEVVQLFNARPEIWWTGMLSAYLMRPSANSVVWQAAFRASQNWSSPIVGVHVRRTDKLASEAKLHQTEEYMRHVQHYCDLKLSSGWQERALTLYSSHAARIEHERRASTTNPRYSECSVYLAADDTTVASELRLKYKHIHFIVNDMALTSSNTGTRFSADGLIGILDDISHLAATDLLVGTFSSQVSRLAYEINQANHTAVTADRAFLYHSVDSMWYFGGQLEYQKCVAFDYIDTQSGSSSVAKGTRLSCPIIAEFEHGSGLMHCFVGPDKKSVMLPPAAVVNCEQSLGNKWYILPQHMRQPGLELSGVRPSNATSRLSAGAAASAAAGVHVGHAPGAAAAALGGKIDVV